jgi:hypothetical protein
MDKHINDLEVSMMRQHASLSLELREQLSQQSERVTKDLFSQDLASLSVDIKKTTCHLWMARPAPLLHFNPNQEVICE